MSKISKLQNLVTPDNNDLLLIVDTNGKPKNKKITVANLLANAQGLKGDKGDSGNDGLDGLSAYQIAVNNGFIGTELDWIASLQGKKGDPGSNANVNPGAWQTPTLQNIWLVNDVIVKYRKLADGRLEIKGTVKYNGIPPTPSTIFILPVGYRPLEAHRYTQLCTFNAEQRATRITINTDGAVNFAAVSNSTVTNTSILNFPLNLTCPLD